MRSTTPDASISHALLQEKAREIGSTLGMYEAAFRGSAGFISRFKERISIVSLVTSGESLSTWEEAVAEWKEKVLPKLLRDYSMRNVYNADETAVFYRVLPHRTHAFKGETCRGGKKSKERMTALMCANMDGSDKLAPLIIGRFKKPRCFRGVRSLPLPYAANRKAWMT